MRIASITFSHLEEPNLFCSRKGAFMQRILSKIMYQETQVSHPPYTPHTTEEYVLGQIVLFLVVLVAVILQTLG